MTESIDSNIQENNSEKGNNHHVLKRWILALCILSLSVTVFTEISGQWFNSYTKYYGGGLSVVGYLVAISAVLAAIFYLIWGTISDNIWTKAGRRVPIYVIGALFTGVFMLIFMLTSNIVLILLIGGVFISITVNMCHVTNRGLIPDLIPQKMRGRINSIIFIMGNIGSMLIWIPAIIFLPSGTEHYSLGTHQIFIAAGALILVLSALFLLLLVKEPKVEPPKSTWTRDLKNILNIEEMSKHKDFLKLFIALIFVIMSEAAFMPFLLILLQDITLNVFEILTVLPFIGAGIGIGIYLIGKYTDKIGRKKIALLCVVMCPVGQLIIALLGHDSLWLITGFGIFMPFYLGLWVSTDSWTQDLLPEESRGRFLGILNIGYALGRVPGVLIATQVGNVYGTLSIFLVAGIILWLGFPFFLKVPETLKP
jgi:MFS family permease